MAHEQADDGRARGGSPGAGPSSSHPLPPGARLLGLAGLIPFIAGALALALLDDAARVPAARVLAGYAAVIVSFLGGVHWGLGFARPRAPTTIFLWGVVPSLIAWVALLLPPAAGLVLLATMLVLCYGVDRAVYPRLGVAHWLPLRRTLSVVAVLSCAAGAWFA
ncbi:MAG: DUF3429 domain-containing protein [Burkholderiales bacterium]|nr:DUF3429 domain-containing protein [Burkholderiales bacterium]